MLQRRNEVIRLEITSSSPVSFLCLLLLPTLLLLSLSSTLFAWSPQSTHKADALTPCAVKRENKRKVDVSSHWLSSFVETRRLLSTKLTLCTSAHRVTRVAHNDFMSSWMPDWSEYAFFMDVFSRTVECTSLPSHCTAARYWFHYLQTACLCRYVNRNPDRAAWIGNCQSDQTVPAWAFVRTVLYLNAEAIKPFI